MLAENLFVSSSNFFVCNFFVYKQQLFCWQISSYCISTDGDENGVDSFGFPRHGRAKSVIGVNSTRGECFDCYVKLRSVIVTYNYKKLIYKGLIFQKNFPLSLLTFN